MDTEKEEKQEKSGVMLRAKTQPTESPDRGVWVAKVDGYTQRELSKKELSMLDAHMVRAVDSDGKPTDKHSVKWVWDDHGYTGYEVI